MHGRLSAPAGLCVGGEAGAKEAAAAASIQLGYQHHGREERCSCQDLASVSLGITPLLLDGLLLALKGLPDLGL